MFAHTLPPFTMKLAHRFTTNSLSTVFDVGGSVPPHQQHYHSPVEDLNTYAYSGKDGTSLPYDSETLRPTLRLEDLDHSKPAPAP